MISPEMMAFPILQPGPTGARVIYLDNAATTQKPRLVIEAMSNFYAQTNANVGRGIYDLAEQATLAYEQVRSQVAKFINAAQAQEIIFVSGTTEAINLVASSYGESNLTAGDEIIVSIMEHHANLVPWQVVAKKTGAQLKVIKLLPDGKLDLEQYQQLISQRTKMVAVTHVSNVLGTINPIKKICEIAHRYQIPVLVDGAQAVAHLPIDVQELGCDFYAFSAHKCYGPTGVGVLYGREKLLAAMPPYQTGGGMIEKVTFSETTFAALPQKFEAGTGNIAGVIGLGAALDFINAVGFEQLIQHEQQLLLIAETELAKQSGLKIIGTSRPKIGLLSLVLDFIHPHDLATILNQEQIAVRAGHHCAMPLMTFYNLPGTVRVAFGIYNISADIEALINGINQARKWFGKHA